MSLEQIKKDLTECCKKRKPVLLHKKDIYGREDLIKKIHLLNGGIDERWEHQGRPENKRKVEGWQNKLKKIHHPVRRNNFCKEYKNHFCDYMRDWNDTLRTFNKLDTNFESGQAVFEKLSCFEYKKIDSSGEIISKLLKVRSWINDNDRPCINKQYQQSDTKELLQYKGTLFIDNLRCTRNDPEDEKGYHRLAEKIDSLQRKVTPSLRGWLVFYAYESSTFPLYFLNQFELVSLDSKDYEVEEQGEKAVVGSVAKIIESEELQEENEGQFQVREPVHFPTPANSKWSDVGIFIRDNEYLKIKVKEKTENIHRSKICFKIKGEYIGLEYKRSRKPTKLWELLKIFARYKGELITIRRGQKKKEVESGLKLSEVKNTYEKTQLTKRVERINKLFIEYFLTIPGKPIPKYSNNIGYKPEFQIEDISYLSEQEASITKNANDNDLNENYRNEGLEDKYKHMDILDSKEYDNCEED